MIIVILLRYDAVLFRSKFRLSVFLALLSLLLPYVHPSVSMNFSVRYTSTFRLH